MSPALALLAFTDWRAPWNRVWTNSTGEYVLAIAPEPRTKGWQMRLSAVGDSAEMKPMWRTVTDFYPHLAMVSNDGHVVTLNEYPGYAHKVAVAVFGDNGKILKRYAVEELMTKAEFESLPGDEGIEPKRWIEVSWFDSIRNLSNVPSGVRSPAVDRKVDAVSVRNDFPVVFRLRTAKGKELWFDLVTGEKH